jgi:DNA-binding NarL/FixJ family response regulator
MAPVDGLQFLKDVRGGRGGSDPQVPIIFLSSASDRNTVQAAIMHDVDGYMVKPVSAEDLKSKIVGVLNRRFAEKHK